MATNHSPRVTPSNHQRRPRVTKRMIEEITRKIVERFRPEKVILFGSRVHGRPGKYSDIDIMVIMKSDKGWAERTAEVIGVAHPGVATDFIVYTPAEVRQRLAMRDFFVKEVLEEGIVLYDAKQDGRLGAESRSRPRGRRGSVAPPKTTVA